MSSEWFNYCPNCGGTMVWPVIIPGNSGSRPKCVNCGYTDYHNPTPAVCALIPRDNGIVLVKRNKSPFRGSWCLPCGFVNHREQPQDAVVREVLEETGLVVRPTKILLACTPDLTNELVLHYLVEVIGGELMAGDDASSAQVFTWDDLPTNIPFKTHRQIIWPWFTQAHSSRDLAHAS